MVEDDLVRAVDRRHLLGGRPLGRDVWMKLEGGAVIRSLRRRQRQVGPFDTEDPKRVSQLTSSRSRSVDRSRRVTIEASGVTELLADLTEPLVALVGFLSGPA